MASHAYIALLKTKSTPTDGYENICHSSKLTTGATIVPQFVPVLLHKFNEDGMSVLHNLINDEVIGDNATSKYGGMIFTSQRAVEAFSAALSVFSGKSSPLYKAGLIETYTH